MARSSKAHVSDRRVRARKSDPSTSHESSAMIEAREGTTATFKPGTQKHRVLAVYASQNRPLTDHQVELRAKLGKRACPWKRCGECRQAAVVELAETKVIDSETDCAVLRSEITKLGRQVLAQLDAGQVVKLKEGPVSGQQVIA